MKRFLVVAALLVSLFSVSAVAEMEEYPSKFRVMSYLAFLQLELDNQPMAKEGACPAAPAGAPPLVGMAVQYDINPQEGWDVWAATIAVVRINGNVDLWVFPWDDSFEIFVIKDVPMQTAPGQGGHWRHLQ